MEFENPVIGTMLPPPANLPILSYTPIAVKKDAKNINATSVHAQALCCDIFGKTYNNRSFIPCPNKQINPPTQKELKRDGHGFVFGILASTYAL